ncbi:YlbF family regulator [Bacillus taeanensis]|uniref:UPF0342 protein DS031_11975 n=1 Tax=Bacillus taeanensis TaxID=273032 RepID=A0A366XTW9_9BACI|nr:YlbF family regulator [Bacillus taeanensis]RBW69347.1 hypothetical protein DS031_11975 [Bacillus taeanensis]
MSNLYDHAYELEKALRNSEEFQTLKKLHQEVEQDEVAKKLFASFRQLQIDLQQKQMMGQQLSEEEVEKAQQQLQLVQQHETIGNLLNAEQRLSQAISDINKIITNPLEEIYGSPEEQQ